MLENAHIAEQKKISPGKKPGLGSYAAYFLIWPLVIAGVIVPAVVARFAFFYERAMPEPVAINEIQTQKPAFSVSLDQVPDIDLIYSEVSEMRIPEERKIGTMRAGIVSHHALVKNKITEFWASAKEQSEPDVIVIVGPNHESIGAEIQTMRGSFETPFGRVSTDNSVVDALVASGAASASPDVFRTEHSIAFHVPYIAKLFPSAKIVPVLYHSSVPSGEVARVLSNMRSALPSNSFFVSSIDFSHGLDSAHSNFNDRKTWNIMQNRSFDELDALQPEFIDSPPSASAYLQAIDAQKCIERVLWHGNSDGFLEVPQKNGTSYFHVACVDYPSDALIVSAVGDIMLGRDVGARLKNGYPDVFDFSLANQGTDISFANLESVLSDKGLYSGKSIYFRGSPERVEYLKKLGINTVSVANNHVDDYGRAAWEDSVANVESAGIYAVGGYMNDNPGPVYIKVRGLRIAFFAFDFTLRRPDLDTVKNSLAKAQDADYIIVSMHFGSEYKTEPNDAQISLAHTAVDSGADMVIGHHPHVLQPMETYKGKPIFYSLGNFIFDQEGEGQNTTEHIKAVITKEKTEIISTPVHIINTVPNLDW
ncbi:MAG: hypothetical protein ACD_76C00027G0005 [uncultured bacterium]|nr:MAG: hypothetical protein ACD_76C00027G0005 [uncultured bacterium]HBD05231.1 AmmeMemoRadiSam system protein B [Candidatus Uhrbacteria bacterium]